MFFLKKYKMIIKKLRPRDILAIVIIITGAIARVFGADGVIGSIMIAVTAAYFGYEKFDEKVLKPDITKAKTEPVDEIIKRVALEEGVDPQLAVRVAKCESGLDPKAKNKNKGGSVDRGLFQWNDYYHEDISDECAYDPECATRAFCKAVKNGHLDWWNATRKCWNSKRL